MPPKVRVAACLTGCRARPRRGQDPSLRTNVHGCFVGGGVPDAPPVSGNRAFTGSHRAGHARPLPRGFGADVTCITAVGRHAPMPPKVRVAARLTGCRARPAEGSRPLPTDYRSRVLCRERRPRRPAGVRQTGVYGQPPGRACPAPTARLWGRCHLYYSRRAACLPHRLRNFRVRQGLADRLRLPAAFVQSHHPVIQIQPLAELVPGALLRRHLPEP